MFSFLVSNHQSTRWPHKPQFIFILEELRKRQQSSLAFLHNNRPCTKTNKALDMKKIFICNGRLEQLWIIIEKYLEMNNTEGIELVRVWEGGKVVLRGKCYCHSRN